MRWDQPNIPHKGWTEIDVIDLADDTDLDEDIEYETCDMCGNEKIRFVHVLIHPEYSGEIHVGCDCAAKMTDDYFNPEARENEVRNRSSRKRNFMKQQWYQNSNGNYVLRYKGEYVTVIPSRYGKGYGVYYRGKRMWEYKGRKIMDLDTAKRAAFDAFDSVYNFG